MKRIILIMLSLVLTVMSCKKDENEPTTKQDNLEITDDSEIEIKLKRPENPFLNDFAKTQEKPGEKIGEETYNVEYPSGETVIVKLEKEEATLVSYAKNSTKKALTTDENSQNIELVELAIMLPNYVWIGEKDYKVTTIGDGTSNVFDGKLSNVTKLIIPEEVKTINTNAFTNCNYIQTFDIKGENKEFKANCFSSSTNRSVTLKLKTSNLPEGATIQRESDGSKTYILEANQEPYKLSDFIEVTPQGYVFGEDWEVSIKYEESDNSTFNIENRDSFEKCTIGCGANSNYCIQVIAINLTNNEININETITFGNKTK